jgi:hypothetical protein
MAEMPILGRADLLDPAALCFSLISQLYRHPYKIRIRNSLALTIPWGSTGSKTR